MHVAEESFLDSFLYLIIAYVSYLRGLILQVTGLCSGGVFLFLMPLQKYRCLWEDHPVAIYAAVLSIELLVRREKHRASWDNTIGSIIAVSALIAMFSVLSSFGIARNHESTNIKGGTRLTWFASKYAACLLCLRESYACSGRIFSGFFLYLIIAYVSYLRGLIL
ncbi:hypothetical protein CEXT_452471 [Caerostris extrusa]|uniref:Uncharacterized protein n=1 Tax=Caerostris extrusa TaxID=172846 RepID=A0AAV4TGK6_CAEEX|nr:hypothetical protein CEXT_452471 [Caerostris extrusa]